MHGPAPQHKCSWSGLRSKKRNQVILNSQSRPRVNHLLSLPCWSKTTLFLFNLQKSRNNTDCKNTEVLMFFEVHTELKYFPNASHEIIAHSRERATMRVMFCSCIRAYLCSATLPGDVGSATKRWAVETIEFAWWQHRGAAVRSVTSQHGRSWDRNPAGSRAFLCGVSVCPPPSDYCCSFPSTVQSHASITLDCL